MIKNWRTSSYTDGNGSCVELGFVVTDDDEKWGDWGVRDSKNQTGPTLSFAGRRAVGALLSALAAGQLARR